MLPDPYSWMAAYRESVIATLAEFGLLSSQGVRLIHGFAVGAGHVDSRRFGDDWVAAEIESDDANTWQHRWQEIDDPEFRSFLVRSGVNSLENRLLHMAGNKRPGSILEIGCGAGGMSPGLSARSDRFVVSDLSLRAVCFARQKVRASGQSCASVVLDAQTLPFSKGAMRLVVAQNVVDLLDDPRRFLYQTARVMTPRGLFLVSTPDPELETAFDCGNLRELMAKAGFVIEHEASFVPWIRFHDSRHVEVYFTDVLALRRQLGS